MPSHNSWVLSVAGYSEDELIERPAIELFGELGRETGNCFHESEQPGGSPLGRETASEVVLVQRLWATADQLWASMNLIRSGFARQRVG